MNYSKQRDETSSCLERKEAIPDESPGQSSQKLSESLTILVSSVFVSFLISNI